MSMPCLNTFVVWLWAIGTAATCALAILMYVTGHCRRWPSLFCYLIFMAAQAFWCAPAKLYWTPSHYFYGFYVLQLLVDGSMVWMIVQIALKVAGITPWLRSKLVQGIPLCTLAALVVFMHLSFSDPMRDCERIVYVVEHVEVAIDLALCFTVTSLIYLTKGVGIQWAGVRGVTSGLMLEVLTSDLSGYVHIHFPSAAINAARGASYLGTVLIWGTSILLLHRRAGLKGRQLRGEIVLQ